MLLSVTVEGDKNEVISILGETEGMIEILDIKSVSHNSFQYRVEIKNDEARKKIINKLVSKDLSISEVQTDHVSLEEVFVKLTKQTSKKKSIHDVFSEIEKGIETNNSSSEISSPDNADNKEVK
jgi:rRNA maturation protein Rpf1